MKPALLASLILLACIPAIAMAEPTPADQRAGTVELMYYQALRDWGFAYGSLPLSHLELDSERTDMHEIAWAAPLYRTAEDAPRFGCAIALRTGFFNLDAWYQRAIIRHEVGHCLGLPDVASGAMTMNLASQTYEVTAADMALFRQQSPLWHRSQLAALAGD